MEGKSKIFEQVETEMKRNGTWGQIASLEVISDGVCIYEIDNEEFVTELVIMADDQLLKDEYPIDLLSKKRIQYLNHSLYLKTNVGPDRISSITYREQ
jgi:hypothetical protein